MTKHDSPEQGFRPEEREEQKPKAIWGHSFAAAAICLGAGAVIALLGILGQPG